jgi:hypothetical protein
MTREQQKELAAALLKWRVERTSATMNGYLDEAEVRGLLNEAQSRARCTEEATSCRYGNEPAPAVLIAVVNELKMALNTAP